MVQRPKVDFWTTPAGISIKDQAAVAQDVTCHIYAATAGGNTQHLTAPHPEKNSVPMDPFPPQTHIPNPKDPTTPVNFLKLAPFLKGYPLAPYILDGFKHGFKLGYAGPQTNTSYKTDQ